MENVYVEYVEVNFSKALTNVFFPQDRVKLLHIHCKGVFSTAKCIVVVGRESEGLCFRIIYNHSKLLCLCGLHKCQPVRTLCTVCHIEECVALPSMTGCDTCRGKMGFYCWIYPKKRVRMQCSFQRGELCSRWFDRVKDGISKPEPHKTDSKCSSINTLQCFIMCAVSSPLWFFLHCSTGNWSVYRKSCFSIVC